MYQLRGKTTSNLQNHHRRSSSKIQQNEQQYFPFSNKTLKMKAWQDESISIKKFKSNLQITRKNYEFIPLLKNMKLSGDKVSIVKSAKNEYNVFVRRQENKINNAREMQIINGFGTVRAEKNTHYSKNFYQTDFIDKNDRHTSFTVKKRPEFSHTANDFRNFNWLNILGQNKSFSPVKQVNSHKSSERQKRMIKF